VWGAAVTYPANTILGLAFSAFDAPPTEAPPSGTVGGAIQIFAVIIMVITAVF